MKNNLLLLLIFFASSIAAQKNDFLLTMNGIGALKIGMSQAEIERLVSQKLILKNARDKGVSYNDTATAKYKHINVTLYFQRQYTADTSFYMYLIGLKTSSALCKTEKGVGIGSNKLQIISAYGANFISMGPEYEDEAFTKKSKTKYQVDVNSDDWKRKIVFSLINNKVGAMEVVTVFSDEE